MSTAPIEPVNVDFVLDNIRAELARRRLNSNTLPRRIGRSQAYWSRRLTGSASLTAEDLILLSAVTGASVGVFFGEPGTVRPRPDTPNGALFALPRLDSNQEPAEDQLDDSRPLAPVIPLHPLKKAS